MFSGLPVSILPMDSIDSKTEDWVDTSYPQGDELADDDDWQALKAALLHNPPIEPADLYAELGFRAEDALLVETHNELNSRSTSGSHFPVTLNNQLLNDVGTSVGDGKNPTSDIFSLVGDAGDWKSDADTLSGDAENLESDADKFAVVEGNLGKKLDKLSQDVDYPGVEGNLGKNLDKLSQDVDYGNSSGLYNGNFPEALISPWRSNSVDSEESDEEGENELPKLSREQGKTVLKFRGNEYMLIDYPEDGDKQLGKDPAMFPEEDIDSSENIFRVWDLELKYDEEDEMSKVLGMEYRELGEMIAGLSDLSLRSSTYDDKQSNKDAAMPRKNENAFSKNILGAWDQELAYDQEGEIGKVVGMESRELSEMTSWFSDLSLGSSPPDLHG